MPTYSGTNSSKSRRQEGGDQGGSYSGLLDLSRLKSNGREDICGLHYYGMYQFTPWENSGCEISGRARTASNSESILC